MLDGREGRNAAPKDAREEKEDEEWKETEDEEEREEERPRNLRFHLVTRACPSRFSSSPYGCSLDGGWGPRETRPPAGSWARHPSLSLFLSLSPSLSHSVSPFHRHLSPPFPRLEKRRWRGDSPRGPTRPNPFPAERAAIQHSRVMLLELGDPREWLRGTNFCRPAGNLGERPRDWNTWLSPKEYSDGHGGFDWKIRMDDWGEEREVDRLVERRFV